MLICNGIAAYLDLMWSDPDDIDTWSVSPRGAGWLFGAKVTQEVTATRVQQIEHGMANLLVTSSSIISTASR
jgi:hypothetical protein